jgi:phospholipid transport system transporter-binding protein
MKSGLVEIEESDGIVRLLGELTFESVARLVTENPELIGSAGLTVDMSGLEKVDSAGLALLLGWVRKARGSGGELRFSGIPEQLRSLVRIADLETLFESAPQA